MCSAYERATASRTSKRSRCRVASPTSGARSEVQSGHQGDGDRRAVARAFEPELLGCVRVLVADGAEVAGGDTRPGQAEELPAEVAAEGEHFGGVDVEAAAEPSVEARDGDQIG